MLPQRPAYGSAKTNRVIPRGTSELATALVDEDVFVDAVVVPQTVRRSLIVPAHRAVVGIERDHRVGELDHVALRPGLTGGC